MDPRVKTPAAALQQQATLSLALYETTFNKFMSDTAMIGSLRRDLADRRTKAPALAAQIDALDKKAADVAGSSGGRGGRGGGGGGGRGTASAGDTFSSMAGEISNSMNFLQESDDAPTSVVVASAQDVLKRYAALEKRLGALVATDVAALNIALKAAGLQPVLQVSVSH
jgi:hypothetical protein